MALNSAIRVPLPEQGLIIRRSGKYQYVYKVFKTYRTDSGQPTNDRKSIGKLDPKSGLLIPNNNYYELYDEVMESSFGAIDKTATSFSHYESVRAIGTTFIIKSILESLNVPSILTTVFGDKKASMILTSAIYMVSRGNIFERVTDWCEGFTIFERVVTPVSASRLFSSITYQERISFFREWVSFQLQSGYLAYDVTSFSTYAKGIHDAEWGYNRDKESLPQINLGCYFGQDNGLPLFYMTYSGSITDKSHLPYMMAYNKELGISNVCFILDRGFCTEPNISYMHKSEKMYLCGVDVSHKEILAVIKEVRDGIISMRNVIKQGLYACTMHDQFYGNPTNLHIYFDPNSVEQQRQNLYRIITTTEEKLLKIEKLTEKTMKRFLKYFDVELAKDGSFTYEHNYEKIDELAKNCGFFCLLTNTDINTEDALSLYRRKDVIEKSFDELKNHIDMKRMHTHNSDTTDGKIFCSFISLIAVSQMTSLLSEFMRSKSMSKDALISELEKIKIITMIDGSRLMNPVTKTQRTIFEACNLSEDDLKAYVNDGL